jgi:hypothetical protein
MALRRPTDNSGSRTLNRNAALLKRSRIFACGACVWKRSSSPREDNRRGMAETSRVGSSSSAPKKRRHLSAKPGCRANDPAAAPMPRFQTGLGRKRLQSPWAMSTTILFRVPISGIQGAHLSPTSLLFHALFTAHSIADKTAGIDVVAHRFRFQPIRSCDFQKQIFRILLIINKP